MKNKGYIYTVILFVIICGFGCKREKYDALSPQKITGELKIKNAVLQSGDMIVMIFKDSISTSEVKIESLVKDSILTSLLSFKLKNNWVKVNNFKIDLKNALYREKMTFLVKKMAQVLKDSFNVSELAEISDMLDAVPELLFGRLSRVNYYKESSQALFYHMGVVNSARRAILNDSKDCDCGIDINYHY